VTDRQSTASAAPWCFCWFVGKRGLVTYGPRPRLSADGAGKWRALSTQRPCV